MNQCDAVGACVEWIRRRVSFALNFHRSVVGPQRAGDDVHQSALARAVFADECMHLALAQFEIDAIERDRSVQRICESSRVSVEHTRTERGSAGSMVLPWTSIETRPGATARGSVRIRAMAISFSDRVKIPDDVLISNLQEESVILNLD